MSLPGSQGTRNPRTLWQSYASLPARTRLFFGLAVGITGAIGLAVADKLQQAFPADRAGAKVPSAQESNELPTVERQE